MAASPWMIADRDTAKPVAGTLEVADGFWSRFIGLQFRRELAEGAGMLLVPCAGIHTFWMRFPIDVVFLSEQGVVLDVRRAVAPWRIVTAPKGAYAVLEMNADSASVLPGAHLQIVRSERKPTPLPASLRFLCA